MAPIQQALPFIRLISWSRNTRTLRLYLNDASLVGHKFSLDISGAFISLDEIKENQYRYKTHFTVGHQTSGNKTGILMATLNQSKYSFNENCPDWQYGKRYSTDPVPTSSCHLNGSMHIFQFEAPAEFALGGKKTIDTTDIPEAGESWFKQAKLKMPQPKAEPLRQQRQHNERGSIAATPTTISDDFVRRVLSQVRLIEDNTDYRLEKKLGNWRFIKGAIE